MQVLFEGPLCFSGIKNKTTENQKWKSAAGKVKLFIYYGRDTLVINRMDHILVSNSAKWIWSERDLVEIFSKILIVNTTIHNCM